MPKDAKSTYSETWDHYVSTTFPRIKDGQPLKTANLKPWQVLNTVDEQYAWPGDEWGDVSAVQNNLQTCIFDYFDSDPACVCELGSGAGRYTELVFRKYPKLKIFAFDVSQLFIDQINDRLSEQSSTGQLQSCLLTADPRLMYQVLDRSGLVGHVDVVYSFDAMVHVDLHTLLLYVATAAATLRQDGILSMNVSDATRDFGFDKLMHDAPGAYARGGNAGAHFQFVSPEIMSMLLERLGFSFDFHDCNGRDLFFTAKLHEPGLARRQFESSGSTWWLCDSVA